MMGSLYKACVVIFKRSHRINDNELNHVSLHVGHLKTLHKFPETCMHVEDLVALKCRRLVRYQLL